MFVHLADWLPTTSQEARESLSPARPPGYRTVKAGGRSRRLGR